MASKASKKAAPFLPYRKVLSEGFVCPGPEYLREEMLQAEPVAPQGWPLRRRRRGTDASYTSTARRANT